jgi:hypothetical protein
MNESMIYKRFLNPDLAHETKTTIRGCTQLSKVKKKGLEAKNSKGKGNNVSRHDNG